MRAGVAFFGAFGYELDATRLTQDERRQVADQVAWFKAHREILQLGRFLRLVSPFEDSGDTAWMSVSEDARHAVVGWYRPLSRPTPGPQALPLRGLDPGLRYRIRLWPETSDTLVRRNTLVRGGDELMAVVAARAAGAGEVVVTARRPQQHEAARHLGADRVFADTETAELDAFAREHPVDVVLETVGGTTADTLTTAINVCRPGGTISVLGLFMGMIPVAPAILLAKELTLKGSMVYNRRGGRADFEITQDLLARERMRLERVVTHRLPLAQAPAAFTLASRPAPGVLKVVVTMGESGAA